MRALAGWGIAFGFLGLSSCDKASDLLKEVSETVEVLDESGGEADESLLALVNRREKGVAFRRDLEFPKEVSGVFRRRITWENYMMHGTSAFGRSNSLLNGSFVTEYEFAKGSGTMQMEYSKYLDRVLSDEEKAALENAEEDETEQASRAAGVVGKPFRFAYSGKQWRYRSGESGDFKAMVLGKELAEKMDQHLIETGSYPQSMWFSATRFWHPGDTLKLDGAAVAMAYLGAQSGALELTFEGEEVVEGHPCGRFSVTGHLKSRASAEGSDESMVTQVTIEKGKLWASLLYPVMMRQETDRIESNRGGAGGAQGRSSIETTLKWRAGAN